MGSANSSDISDFKKTHPQMQVDISGNELAFSGRIDVEDNYGYVLERYDVKIIIPTCYPFCFPVVLETSGKIPRNIDWHITSGEGRLCLAVRPEERLMCKKGITLNWFMEKVLIPHLASQTYKLKYGKYPKGECAHGKNGIKQYYLRLFQTGDIDFVFKSIALASLGLRPETDEPCLCGSRKKFINCHAKAFSVLEELGRGYLKAELIDLTKKK